MEIKEKIVHDILSDYLLHLNNYLSFHNKNELSSSTIFAADYVKKIGYLFIDNQINFESNYDLEIKKIDNSKNKKLSKNNVFSCNITPCNDFLEGLLPVNVQKDALLSVLTNFNLNHEEDLKNQKSIDTIINTIKDLRKFGVNSVHINDYLVSKILTNIPSEFDPNIFIAFVSEGFFFDENFMKKEFKKNYNDFFGSNTGVALEYVCEQNRANKIKYIYNKINSELVVKNEDKKVKIKI